MRAFVARPWDDYIDLYGAPATLYGPDAATLVAATKVVSSNARYIPMLGTSRGELGMMQFKSQEKGVDLVVNPAQIVVVPSLPLQWFVLVKTLVRTPSPIVGAATLCAVMPLPLVLTVIDYGSVDQTTLNSYGEPVAVNAAGDPVIPTQTQRTVRAALSNQFDPLNNNPEGDLPASLETVVTPLETGIEKGDEIFLPDGRSTVVSQTNQLYADGVPYALQLILAGSAASGSQPL
jgi:hypothetical protein